MVVVAAAAAVGLGERREGIWIQKEDRMYKAWNKYGIKVSKRGKRAIKSNKECEKRVV